VQLKRAAEQEQVEAATPAKAKAHAAAMSSAPVAPSEIGEGAHA